MMSFQMHKAATYNSSYNDSLDLVLQELAIPPVINPYGKSDSGPKLLPGEGDIGTYKELKDAGTVGDNITPHHMPSAEYMSRKKVSRDDGLCMNVEMPSPGKGGRHRLTATYGGHMNDAQKEEYYSLTPRDALSRDINDLKQIYTNQGLYSEIRPKLQQYINKYEEYMPELFGKHEGDI